MSQKSTSSNISKLAKPTGLPQPKAGGSKPPSATPSSSRAQNALEQSARAVGLSSSIAEQYATSYLAGRSGPEAEFRASFIATEFKVGDRVWVGGNKPGVIAFIGETRFAAGEWAGIVLDQPIGKNDGSLNGVRYFQCEAKRGLFSKTDKLSREPNLSPPSAEQATSANDNAASVGSASNAQQSNDFVAPTPIRSNSAPQGKVSSATDAPAPLITSTPVKPAVGSDDIDSQVSAAALSARRPSGLVRPGFAGSQTNLHRASSSSPSGSVSNLSLPPVSGGSGTELKIGDRVVVGGTKAGVVRYVGTTEFAAGDWIGVELDEAQGKNNGIVGGKRYFECKAQHGLFAPAYRVSLQTPTVPATPQQSKLTLPAKSGALAQSKPRSGSQESVSSVGSSASTASRSRGISTGKTSSGGSKPLVNNASTTGIQKVLKEKEDHIEQLLKERDLERSEVARAAVQIDETQSTLVSLRTEYENYKTESVRMIEALQTRLEHLELENVEKASQLEEERRKIEDLEFTLEEETINKSDVESKISENARKVQSLEHELTAEKERAKALEKEVMHLKGHLDSETNQHRETEKSANYYLDRIEELTSKLQEMEKALETSNNSKKENNEKMDSAKEELQKNKVLIDDLQKAVEDSEKNTRTLNDTITNLTTELTLLKETNVRQQQFLTEAAEKQSTSDSSIGKLNADITKLNTQLQELEQEKSNFDLKCNQLEKEKKLLEQQVVDVMKSSGSSATQISLIEDQLQERERKITELKGSLEEETKKAKEFAHQLEEEKMQNELKYNAIVSKYSEEMKSLVLKHSDELRLALAKQANESASEKENYTKEIGKLKDELKKKINDVKLLEDKLVHLKGDEEKIFKLEGEKEELVKENDRLDKLSRRVVSERDKLIIERDQLMIERDSLVTERNNFQGNSEKKLKELETLRDKLTEDKLKESQARHSAEDVAKKLEQECTALQLEKSKLISEASIKEEALKQLQNELESVQKRQADLYTKVIEAEHDKESLQKALRDSTAAGDLCRQQIGELELTVESITVEKTRLLRDNESLQLSLTDHEQTLKEVASLKKQVEDLEDRSHRSNDKEFQIQEEHEAELAKLQDGLNELTLQLKSKSEEIDKLKSEIKKYQDLKSSVEKTNSEKKLLEGRIKDLEKQLQSSASRFDNNNSLDAVHAQLKAEKESSDKQIEFLNSVIVELQSKVEKLQLRLKAMEDGSVLNGGSDAENSISHGGHSKVPRLFCDICEVFDQHDTDDCPLQATSDSPPPSLHHGIRGSERPYCETCESFGHWTKDCDDEQTF